MGASSTGPGLAIRVLVGEFVTGLVVGDSVLGASVGLLVLVGVEVVDEEVGKLVDALAVGDPVGRFVVGC